MASAVLVVEYIILLCNRLHYDMQGNVIPNAYIDAILFEEV